MRARNCLHLLVDGTRLELVTSALRTRPARSGKSGSVNNLKATGRDDLFGAPTPAVVDGFYSAASPMGTNPVTILCMSLQHREIAAVGRVFQDNLALGRQQSLDVIGDLSNATTWLVGLASTMLAVGVFDPAKVQSALAWDAPFVLSLLWGTVLCGVGHRVVAAILRLRLLPHLLELQARQVGATLAYETPTARILSRQWDPGEIVARMKDQFDVDYRFLLEHQAPLELSAGLRRATEDLRPAGSERNQGFCEPWRSFLRLARRCANGLGQHNPQARPNASAAGRGHRRPVPLPPPSRLLPLSASLPTRFCGRRDYGAPRPAARSSSFRWFGTW